MKKKFLGNLFFVLLLNLLVKPFWIFGIDVGVQNRVGAEEYGLYYPIFGLSIMLNILLDFGITNYNNRNIAQNPERLKNQFSAITSVKFLLGVVYFIATISLAYLLGYKSRAVNLLMLLCVSQFLVSFILFLRSNISGLQLFKLDGFISVFDRILMILICSILLWFNPFEMSFKIEWFVYAQLLAYGITAIVAYFLVFSRVKEFKFNFDKDEMFGVMRKSAPFALLVLLMSFYYRQDAVMVERILENGKEEAGIYAQAYRILEAFNMLGFMLAGILLPLFSKMLKNKEKIDGVVRLSFNLIFIPSLVVAIIGFVYSVEVMDLLYANKVQESAKVFQWLIISFISIGLTYVYGTLLTANGSLKQLNVISLLGVALNFVMNWVLIEKYGAFGAALGTLFTQIFIILAQVVVAKKALSISYDVKFIVRNCFLVLIAIGTISILNQFAFNWIFSSILLTIIVVIALFMLRLVKLSELKGFLKNA